MISEAWCSSPAMKERPVADEELVQRLITALEGQSLPALAWVGLWQVVFSLPVAALLYFPCKAIASPHKKG